MLDLVGNPKDRFSHDMARLLRIVFKNQIFFFFFFSFLVTWQVLEFLFFWL